MNATSQPETDRRQGDPGPRWVVTPVLAPEKPIDVTEALISAVAHELWRTRGGNEALNWMEAEQHVERLIRASRRIEPQADRGRKRSACSPPDRLSFADAILALHAARRGRDLPDREASVSGATRASLERFVASLAAGVEVRSAPERAWLERAPRAPGDEDRRLATRIGIVDPAGNPTRVG